MSMVAVPTSKPGPGSADPSAQGRRALGPPLRIRPSKRNHHRLQHFTQRSVSFSLFFNRKNIRFGVCTFASWSHNVEGFYQTTMRHESFLSRMH